MSVTFDIPVALFLFKRDKAVRIIERIREVRPQKVYLLADHGRNREEREQAEQCRRLVEDAIDWDCEVIRNYAEENRGVYQNIGMGAKWVLEREKWAIFLEDDNLPEVTFFEFCREMLHRYEDDTRVLWVCGTNYLGDYQPTSGDSYVFTRHMLPCGWASWADKFIQFYDGELNLCDDETVLSRIGDRYCNKKVYEQYRYCWTQEYRRMRDGGRPISWDYQMDFSIKANNLFGICPCRNQIRNIGVDDASIHGGNSFAQTMTKRFCGMESYPLTFPLTHPKALLVDPVFEKKIGHILLYPLKRRIKSRLILIARRLLGVPHGSTLKQHFGKRR